jgi:Iron-containing redox enzyme
MTITARDDRLAPQGLPIRVPDSPAGATTIETQTGYLLSAAHEDLAGAGEVLARLRTSLPGTLEAAFGREDDAALLDLHKALYAIYELPLSDPLFPGTVHQHSPWLAKTRWQIEGAWLAFEMAKIRRRLPDPASVQTGEAISAWFLQEAANETELDRTVVRFLATEADLEQFKLFVLSDGPLNYRFYDALVLAEIHVSELVKQEISHHMWDECGEGDGVYAHTVQFTRTLQTLGLTMPRIPVWEDWRPYAGHNLYFLLGFQRRHHFKALGSLAMPELFDSARDQAVVDGLERLGFRGDKDFEYFFNHVEGDADHGPSWIDNVVVPCVEASPASAIELATGGALRMEAMRRYNGYLADRFGLIQHATVG